MCETPNSCLLLIVDDASTKASALVQWVENFCVENSFDKSRVLYRKFQDKPKFWAMLYACGRFGLAIVLDTSPGHSIHTGITDAVRNALVCATIEGTGMQSRGEILRAIGLYDLLAGKDQCDKKAKVLEYTRSSYLQRAL